MRPALLALLLLTACSELELPPWTGLDGASGGSDLPYEPGGTDAATGPVAGAAEAAGAGGTTETVEAVPPDDTAPAAPNTPSATVETAETAPADEAARTRQPGTLAPLAPVGTRPKTAPAAEVAEAEAEAAPEAAKEKPAPDPDRPDPASLPRCDARALDYLLGQPTSELTKLRFPIGTRFIGPTSAVTQDFSRNRLNFEFNKFGIVTRIYCG